MKQLMFIFVVKNLKPPWMVCPGPVDGLSSIYDSNRRVEDKLDARMLHSEPINIRCDNPPTSKRVAITFPGWLVYQNGSVESNCWSSCLMMQDRYLSLC